MTDPAAVIGVILVLLSSAYLVLSGLLTRSFLGGAGAPRPPGAGQLPAVSVLKPIAGPRDFDPHCLASFCAQRYPRFEIVFALPRESGELVPLLEGLRAAHPGTPIRWTSAATARGPNRKAENLAAAAAAAGHDLLVISDADVRVEPDFLERVAEALLRDGVGLVTCLYRNTRLAGLWSTLHALTVQTEFIPHVMFGRRLEGLSYGFGAASAVRRADLERIGGMPALADYLADDYQLGRRITRTGLRAELVPFLVEHVGGALPFRDFFRQRLRAAITEKACRPLEHVLSILTGVVPVSLAFLAAERFSPGALAVFLSACGLRAGTASLLNRSALKNRELRRRFWLTPLNDLLGAFFWLLSLFTSVVSWKGRRYRVLTGGRMVELPSRVRTRRSPPPSRPPSAAKD